MAECETQVASSVVDQIPEASPVAGVKEQPSNFEDKRWTDIMCNRSSRLRDQMSRLAALTFVLNRQENEFVGTVLNAQSNVLALVVYNLPVEEDERQGIVVTGWRLKSEEHRLLVVDPSTFVLRKSVSRRHGIDAQTDSALRSVALDMEDVRRSVAQGQLEMAHLYKLHRVNKGLLPDERTRLRELQRYMSDTTGEPAFPRLLAGLKGITDEHDFNVDEFLVWGPFRKAIIELARHRFDRGALQMDEVCATKDGVIDFDMLWDLLRQRIGAGGLTMLVDDLLRICVHKHGHLTFFPADLLPPSYQGEVTGHFIDLNPILAVDDNGAPTKRSRVFVWDIARYGFHDSLQLMLPGVRADFANIPPRTNVHTMAAPAIEVVSAEQTLATELAKGLESTEQPS